MRPDAATRIKIRAFLPEDRNAVAEMLRRAGVFTDIEMACALELIDLYLRDPNQRDYDIVSAVTPEGEVLGYACYGPTPLTVGVYDLYWIVVDPRHQGQGVAGELLRTIERRLKGQRARMLVVETSSIPAYERARRFYSRNGYTDVARVPDFYADGNDKIIFVKKL